MASQETMLKLLVCALLGVALVQAHTVAVCYNLDVCTGDYTAAYGTYHGISEFSDGCSGNPSGKCPSGYSIIDGNRVDFTSLVLAGSDGAPPGWDVNDCYICPSRSMAENEVWQQASVTLSPGDHTVTLAATSVIEEPISGCWPITLTVGGTVSSSIACPTSTVVNQGSYPSCSRVATFSDATCSVDSATCPGVTCSVSQESGLSSGSTFPLGTSTTNWRLYIDGDSTSQTCTHSVTVQDTTAPQNIACPADVTETCTSPAGATATFGAATANDCNSISWTQTHTSGQNFPVGTTSVTYTATDAFSQSSSCNFNVNIVGGTVTWSQACPSDMLITNFTPGSPTGSTTVSWSAPTALDSCGNTLGVNHIGGPTPGSSFDVVGDNPTTITYQTNADPLTGQRLTCSFEVSFGYAQITAVTPHLNSPPADTIAMYIPFTLTIEYVNIPQTSGNGRLWLSDGSNTHNMQELVTGAQTFDTGVLETDFLGPYGLFPGSISLWLTVDGNPFLVGNQLSLNLAVISI